MPVESEAATALEDEAVEGLTGVRAADLPGARADNVFREPGSRLQQCDPLGERINHGRTLANELRTLDCSKYVPKDALRTDARYLARFLLALHSYAQRQS